jgi:predicted acetyltransferase
MPIELRRLGEADLEQMWQLEREAFNASPAHAEWWKADVRRTGFERWHGLFAGARLAAMAALLPFRQWFGGRSVPMGGVAAVAVRPEYRGRGCARRLLRAGLAAMRTRGEVISALFPSVVPPYRGLGWEFAGVVSYYSAPTRALAVVPASDVSVRRGGAADVEALRRCYTRVARTSSGLLDRTDERWRWTLERRQDDFLFLAGDDGYVIYGHAERPEAGQGVFNLMVSELVAATPEAFRALWRMLGSPTSPFVPTVIFRGAPQDPLSLVLPLPDVSLQRQRLWMLRLVDAPSAIAARGYATGMTATVALEIADDECQSNAGRFVLVVENGCGRLEPGGGGDVRIGVGALASLYSGWASTAALAGAGLLAGGSDAQRAALDVAFAGPTPWLLDEF